MIDKQGLTYIPLSKILRTQFESQSSEAEGDYKGCPLISYLNISVVRYMCFEMNNYKYRLPDTNLYGWML